MGHGHGQGEGGARCRDEEDREVGPGPVYPLGGGAGRALDPILDTASVEAVRGELRDCRVHPVLGVQDQRHYPRVHHPLEERDLHPLCLARIGGDGGRQLVVVPHKHQLLAAADDGYAWQRCATS